MLSNMSATKTEGDARIGCILQTDAGKSRNAATLLSGNRPVLAHRDGFRKNLARETLSSKESSWIDAIKTPAASMSKWGFRTFHEGLMI